jgi:hypothetical protein
MRMGTLLNMSTACRHGLYSIFYCVITFHLPYWPSTWYQKLCSYQEASSEVITATRSAALYCHDTVTVGGLVTASSYQYAIIIPEQPPCSCNNVSSITMPALVSATYSSASSPRSGTPATSDVRSQAERTRDERSDAETLLALKRSTDRRHSPTLSHSPRDERHGSAYPPSPARSSKATDVQEYHSLDDTVGYVNPTERSPQLHDDPGALSSGAPSPGASAAPGSGQVCR